MNCIEDEIVKYLTYLSEFQKFRISDIQIFRYSDC